MNPRLIPRFDFRLTIATMPIGSKYARLKEENEKTLPVQRDDVGGDPWRSVAVTRGKTDGPFAI
jgi:hypothetical protein